MNQPAEFEDQDFSQLIDLEEMTATIAALEYTGQRFLAVMEEIFEMLGEMEAYDEVDSNYYRQTDRGETVLQPIGIDLAFGEDGVYRDVKAAC